MALTFSMKLEARSPIEVEEGQEGFDGLEAEWLDIIFQCDFVICHTHSHLCVFFNFYIMEIFKYIQKYTPS